MNDVKPKSKLFRGLAAATLAVWLVAQFFCTLHCTSGAASLATVSAAKDCCHKGRAAQPTENSTPSNCFAFKLLAPTQNGGHDLISASELQPIAAVLLAEL